MTKKTKVLNCVKCKKSITKTHEKIQCVGECKGWYHQGCSELTLDEYHNYKRKAGEKWICNKCLESDSESESDADSEDEIPSKERKLKTKSEKFNVDIFDNPKPTNKQILETMKKMFEEIQKSVTFNGSMIEDLKADLKKITEGNKKLKKEQIALKNRVADLEQEVLQIRSSVSDERNEDRLKNIVIVGLKGDQDAKKDVTKVLNYLKVGISEQEYEVKILPSKESKKPVLVTFSQKAIRDKVLLQRKSVSLDTNTCGITSGNTSKIFLNEDLCKHSRELFKKARELKRHGFKYVWCKNGSILVRKDDNGPIKKMLTAGQITNLIPSVK